MQIAIDPLGPDPAPRVLDRQELAGVQAFVPQPAVEYEIDAPPLMGSTRTGRNAPMQGWHASDAGLDAAAAALPTDTGAPKCTKAISEARPVFTRDEQPPIVFPQSGSGP